MITATKCSCGAITVSSDVNQISMPEELFNEHFPDLELEDNEWGSCDACVNHWGLHLCACGSGESPDDCKEGYPNCGEPSQKILDLFKERSYEMEM